MLFPIVERITVRNFDLYPGEPKGSGLNRDFLPGVTLVIGANGLGKSTLVLLLYRLLTGPAEVSGDRGQNYLGSGQLHVRPFRDQEFRVFAQRVGDAAAEAEAVLVLRLGDVSISVSRTLNNLRLSRLVVDGVEVKLATEDDFRSAVVAASEVGQFLDWLLVLRYLVFFSEDRRSLVWDPTAQRRVLRLLFSPPTGEDPIGTLETKILRDDSRARNVSATLSVEERKLQSQEKAMADLPDMQGQLGNLIEQREDADREIEALRARAGDLELARAEARLTFLRARERRQDLVQLSDSLRLRQVQAAFPSTSATAAYILTQILTDDHCTVCGSDVPDYAKEVERRLSDALCVICGSSHLDHQEPGVTAQELSEVRATLSDATVAERVAQDDRDVVEKELEQSWRRLTELDEIVLSATTAIEQLELSVPKASRSQQKRREAIRELRLQNNALRDEVLRDKATLTEMVRQSSLRISEVEQRVRDRFTRYAFEFLLDSASLVWSEHIEQLGQLGRGIVFSVFQIDMRGTATEEQSRRSSDAVSESQREFIDLAFRMALIEVASRRGSGTMVMDAPESSLDAVFAPRAARVLTTFANESGESRVVLTSNLVDGRLIPTIAMLSNIDGPQDKRVINLFEIAAPTRALVQLRSKYDSALDRAFSPLAAEDLE